MDDLFWTFIYKKKPLFTAYLIFIFLGCLGSLITGIVLLFFNDMWWKFMILFGALFILGRFTVPAFITSFQDDFKKWLKNEI